MSHSIVNGSVLVRYWFGDFIHGSGFGSAEPKNPGSVVHYSMLLMVVFLCCCTVLHLKMTLLHVCCCCVAYGVNEHRDREGERDVQGSKFMVFQLSLLAFFNAQFNNHHMSFLFIFI